MAFEIIYKDITYKGFSFIEFDANTAFEKSIKQFLEIWNSEDSFSYRSSGTTGIPKTFTFPKSSLVASANATINALGLQAEQEHVLMCLSPSFVGGAMMIARALVLNCSCTLIPPTSDILNELNAHHPYTFASFVPLQLQTLQLHSEKYNLIKNVLVGGASIPKPIERQLSIFTNRTYHTYAMTETLSHVALRQIGKEQGYQAILPYSISLNEHSCLRISGGFLAEPIQTNDLGKFIDNERFFIVGRTDFVINSGGIKIQPEALELVLQEWDELGQTEIAIGKLSHPILGEECVLFVSGDFDENRMKNLNEFLKGKGYQYEIPKRYFSVNGFPRNENGKLDRNKLNECLENQ